MEITSVQNARVKMWAQLLQKKGRDQQNKFTVEGIHLVEELLRSDWEVDALIRLIDRDLPVELAAFADKAWIEVTDAVLAKCTEAAAPQPVMAVADRRFVAWSDMLASYNALLVALDGIQDPGNLGTIIRSADAVAASGVWMGAGCVDLYNPKSVRATMGSLFHLPVAEAPLEEALLAARNQGVQIISTTLDGDESIYDVDWQKPSCLIIGNEARGVSPQLNPLIDRRVRIPMPGQAESLNAGMAATIVLYEALRQRRHSE